VKYSLIKKFSGKNLLKIFEKIKEDVGSNAVILGYDEKDIGGEKYYEVVVGVLNNTQNQNQTYQQNTQNQKKEEKPSTENFDYLREISRKIEEMKRDFEGIKMHIELISRRNFLPYELKLPSPALSLFKKLIARGVERNIALSIVEDIISHNMKPDDSSFSKIITSYVNFRNPLNDVFRGERKFIALVGPTGVGKTTTAAKISAICIMNGIKSVALLGTDRYRIGSVEQIKKYADIMGIPLFVATNSEELTGIWKNLEKFQLVIIDTIGKSQYDLKNIRKIASLIKDIGSRRKIEVILLLSCSQREEEMINVMRGFSEMNIDYVIFTKIDETSYPGVILNIGSFLEVPLAFFTVGQSVPDDIKVASPKTLTEILLGPPPLSRYAFQQ